ncbi:Bgt-50724 [Blumeria graminis f. sp. tritici]|uniref:Bgt-50724 n=1 Tax=Blumeria graminis f. sp. tritici TaxID=62690 RepID=A0A9X9PRB4_BLUGR|nr:Bgt-50724 [Blumeria graminis f. sp. tritici]
MWTVFFEGRKWSSQTKRIWESYEKRDKSLKRKSFNRVMTEDQIWGWLKMFKDRFLKRIPASEARPITEGSAIGRKNKNFQLKGHYCRTVGSGQLIGSRSPRQLDFLIKSIDLPLDAVTDWKDIGVIGEFSVKSVRKARKEKFDQLTRYAREIFCSQPLRRFLHGFCLYKSDLELWLFDRSGAYSTGLISIKHSQEYLVRAISSYLLMSRDELGFDKSIKEKDGEYFVLVKKEGSKSTKRFNINPVPVVRPETLVTRGTTCFETIDKDNIIKYSWNRDPGNTEVNLLKEAKGTEGVVEYVMSDKIWQIKNHVQKLDFSGAVEWSMAGKNKFISKGSGPRKPTLQPFQRDRHLTRVVVTPRGRPLHCSRTILEFLIVIRDSIVAHRRLYFEKDILHCDISEGNIVLVRPDGDNSIQGMLIDLDHAVSLNDDRKKDDNSLLTGTMKFMALERLSYAATYGSTIQCTYRHDLESFFYVFLVGCIEYERKNSSKEVIKLQMWCSNNISSNESEKIKCLTYFRMHILDVFSISFSDLKDLAIKLRNILFGEAIPELGTPDDPNPMYDGMIMAFSNTIEQIRGKINLPQFELAAQFVYPC